MNDKDKPSDDGNGETINGDLNEKQIKSPRKKQKAETTNKGGKAGKFENQVTRKLC